MSRNPGEAGRINQSIGILNVGAGDTKLTFDRSNPQECIRAARIVKDMLRRGYALLIEVDDGKGGKKTERVREFREDTCEYIIADLDPEIAADADREERNDGASSQAQAPAAGSGGARRGPRLRVKTRTVDASRTNGVAVARSAGG